MKRIVLALAASLSLATPAFAQWTQVAQVPTADIFSVFTKGDTVVAASDSTVFVSTDTGATWTPSATVVTGSTQVNVVRLRNGRLYAGTFGQGVFVSDDLGASWKDFNQGLVGGFANSQLLIKDLVVRGDTIFAGTAGSAVWIRNLRSGGWSHYGNGLEPAQASSVEGLAASGTRIFSCSGANGDVYHRDLTDTDWQFDYLLGHVAAGLAPLAAVWTGNSWIVGTNIGVFRSTTGISPWVYTDFGLHPTFFASFALHDGVVFTSFASGEGTGIEFSTDDGATWTVFDAQPGIFTYRLATLGTTLFAGRVDGLWRRSIANVSVPPVTPVARVGFAIAGPHPVRDDVRFRIELPEAGRVRIDLFDLAGRRVADGIDRVLPAGASELSWTAGPLPPGLYTARLRAGERTASLRLVRLR